MAWRAAWKTRRSHGNLVGSEGASRPATGDCTRRSIYGKASAWLI
jgi:hypothetical protein